MFKHRVTTCHEYFNDFSVCVTKASDFETSKNLHFEEEEYFRFGSLKSHIPIDWQIWIALLLSQKKMKIRLKFNWKLSRTDDVLNIDFKTIPQQQKKFFFKIRILSQKTMYSLLIIYLFLRHSKYVDFLATWEEQIRPKVNKLPSTEGISCTTSFYKLPGLPHRSQILTNIWQAGSTY